MILKAKYIVDSKYSANTTLDFWKNLKEGDLIEFSILIEQYCKPEVSIACNGKTYKTSMRKMAPYLEKIELIELIEELREFKEIKKAIGQ